MPKSFNQKLKILYLMDVLLERTDEEHPISAKDMAQYLRGYGISVERKTVYDDIEALRIYGLDIRNRRGKVGGFYIANRKFQLPEVKFLMDAVQSSRFVTQKKSRELLRKWESLVIPEAAKRNSVSSFLSNQAIRQSTRRYTATSRRSMTACPGTDRSVFIITNGLCPRKSQPKKNGEAVSGQPVEDDLEE